MDITARSLTKIYREQDGPVIDDVDLTVTAGSFLALMGRSGSGKSTLLNLLAGIVRPTSGQVFYGETELWHLSDSRRSQLRATATATIFQSYNLFDFLSVRENIALSMRLAGHRADPAIIADALAQVGMTEFLTVRPDELSGGQRQRVAVARAVASAPQVIFADEPTGALDEHNGQIVVDLLRDLATAGTTALMVTHDPDIAAAADRTLVLRDGVIDGEMAGTR